jgi:hypothetical protein
MEIVLLTIGLISVVFIASHLRPLRENEINALSEKRRNKEIKKYFSFNVNEYSVNKNFKKTMNPNGKFYQISEDLYTFPSLSAGLLKYKKHEWIIISFEKDKKIPLIWLNKGFDRSRVSPYLSVSDLIYIANRDGYTSVMISHNHPNRNPNHYDCSRPSSQDLFSANEFAAELNKHGINLLEFICERGRHYRYYAKYSDDFLATSKLAEKIKNENGQTMIKNLSLHIERMF